MMSTLLDNRLVSGINFSLGRQAQILPDEKSLKVVVIGGGVTGLVTAWVLLDRGYKVTILSKEWATYTKSQRLTSQIAGALWEYPPAVCGSHTNRDSLIRSKSWCMTSYHIFEALAADPDLSKESGVRMTRSAFFFPEKIASNPKQLDKFLQAHAAGIRGVKYNAALIEELGVDKAYGIKDAYELNVPVIDTDVGMNWLMGLVDAKGAEFVTGYVEGDLLSQEEVLLNQHNAAVIINATGIASYELAGDTSCYPLRGALLRYINDGADFPKITAAMSIAAGDAIDNEIVFLVPRNDNTLIVGGIAQPHETKLDLTLASPSIQRMQARCKAFLPVLKNARLDPEYPLAQGLRPARTENIRLEREQRVSSSGNKSRIVHSYGHGGSGWSLSFGCAEEVAALVDNMVMEHVVDFADNVANSNNKGILMLRARL